jgi:hypothetical protein
MKCFRITYYGRSALVDAETIEIAKEKAIELFKAKYPEKIKLECLKNLSDEL